MRIDDLLKLAQEFYSEAAKKTEKLPPNSDNVKEILKNIEGMDTFAAKKKYAEKNLERLSSGSSRIVYVMPDGTVLKLAKNERGVAQNKAEGNPKMKSRYLNETIGLAKNHSWLNTYYLDKITEKEFEEMTDIDFKLFGKCISYGLKKISSDSEKKPKDFDKIAKTKIYKEFERLGKEFNLLPGDMSRISSFGQRSGHPVLIDAGLTRKIFDKFY